MALRIGSVRVSERDGALYAERDARGTSPIRLDGETVEALEHLLLRATRPRTRAGFRVDLRDVPQQQRLVQLRLQLAGAVFDADEVIDISLSGVRACVADQRADVLLPGRELELELAYGEHRAGLPATVVRRRHGQQVAFQFDAARVGQDPPLALVQLFRALELAWLRARRPGQRAATVDDRGR